ncbi:hypothetical protein RJT34_32068 [Clitoria ternatea]|uniref:Uncharacterized protein n=1 Tax=Clitoria ternatea TaxID=43366 RepID=A0AAN9I464_CLITE
MCSYHSLTMWFYRLSSFQKRHSSATNSLYSFFPILNISYFKYLCPSPIDKRESCFIHTLTTQPSLLCRCPHSLPSEQFHTPIFIYCLENEGGLVATWAINHSPSCPWR